MTDIKRYEINYEMFHAVSTAMSKDEALYYLMGVYVHDVGNTRRYVATDGHILLICVDENPMGEKLPEKGIIIGGKFPKYKSNIAYNMIRILDDKTVVFGDDNSSFAGYVVDGEYPDYSRVLPQETNKAKCYVVVNPMYLKKITDFVGVGKIPFVNDEHSPAVFTNDNRIGVIMPMRGDDCSPSFYKSFIKQAK